MNSLHNHNNKHTKEESTKRNRRSVFTKKALKYAKPSSQHQQAPKGVPLSARQLPTENSNPNLLENLEASPGRVYLLQGSQRRLRGAQRTPLASKPRQKSRTRVGSTSLNSHPKTSEIVINGNSKPTNPFLYQSSQNYAEICSRNGNEVAQSQIGSNQANYQNSIMIQNSTTNGVMSGLTGASKNGGRVGNGRERQSHLFSAKRTNFEYTSIVGSSLRDRGLVGGGGVYGSYRNHSPLSRTPFKERKRKIRDLGSNGHSRAYNSHRVAVEYSNTDKKVSAGAGRAVFQPSFNKFSTLGSSQQMHNLTLIPSKMDIAEFSAVPGSQSRLNFSQKFYKNPKNNFGENGQKSVKKRRVEPVGGLNHHDWASSRRIRAQEGYKSGSRTPSQNHISINSEVLNTSNHTHRGKIQEPRCPCNPSVDSNRQISPKTDQQILTKNGHPKPKNYMILTPPPSTDKLGSIKHQKQPKSVKNTKIGKSHGRPILSNKAAMIEYGAYSGGAGRPGDRSRMTKSKFSKRKTRKANIENNGYFKMLEGAVRVDGQPGAHQSPPGTARGALKTVVNGRISTPEKPKNFDNLDQNPGRRHINASRSAQRTQENLPQSPEMSENRVISKYQKNSILDINPVHVQSREADHSELHAIDHTSPKKVSNPLKKSRKSKKVRSSKKKKKRKNLDKLSEKSERKTKFGGLSHVDDSYLDMKSSSLLNSTKKNLRSSPPLNTKNTPHDVTDTPARSSVHSNGPEETQNQSTSQKLKKLQERLFIKESGNFAHRGAYGGLAGASRGVSGVGEGEIEFNSFENFFPRNRAEVSSEFVQQSIDFTQRVGSSRKGPGNAFVGADKPENGLKSGTDDFEDFDNLEAIGRDSGAVEDIHEPIEAKMGAEEAPDPRNRCFQKPNIESFSGENRAQNDQNFDDNDQGTYWNGFYCTPKPEDRLEFDFRQNQNLAKIEASEPSRRLELSMKESFGPTLTTITTYQRVKSRNSVTQPASPESKKLMSPKFNNPFKDSHGPEEAFNISPGLQNLVYIDETGQTIKIPNNSNRAQNHPKEAQTCQNAHANTQEHQNNPQNPTQNPKTTQSQKTQKSPKRSPKKPKTHTNSSNPTTTSNPYSYKKVKEHYQDGSTYIGYKLNSKKHGKGTLILANGSRYEGDWRNDVMSGLGKLFYDSNILAYEGGFLNNKVDGHGIMHNDQFFGADGTQKQPSQRFDYRDLESIRDNWVSFEGTFREDMKEGIGKWHLGHEGVFVGEFRGDKANGRGMFIFGDRVGGAVGKFGVLDGGGVKVLGRWAENKLIEVYN